MLHRLWNPIFHGGAHFLCTWSAKESLVSHDLRLTALSFLVRFATFIVAVRNNWACFLIHWCDIYLHASCFIRAQPPPYSSVPRYLSEVGKVGTFQVGTCILAKTCRIANMVSLMFYALRHSRNIWRNGTISGVHTTSRYPSAVTSKVNKDRLWADIHNSCQFGKGERWGM